MILKIGSSGEDVKKLQSKLGLNADGAFGPGTETAVKKWQKDNLDKDAAKTAKRRAAKLKALPNWLTKEELEQIKELYTCAQMFKLYTGEEYHVDHIIPLQGENVCGLHVPWNLQVIPAKENLSKSNKLQEQ